MIAQAAPVVVDRQQGVAGELVLRRVGTEFEIVSNGVFLMDTRDGRSERLLAEAALQRHQLPRRVLIGGLGVGFTLGAVLRDPRVEAVTLVELEPAVVRWQRGPLAGCSGHGLDDPRVELVLGDVLSLLGEAGSAAWDVICLDIDNGPDWTVTPANEALYSAAGTRLLRERLGSGGVLSVWSAHEVPAYRHLLEEVFGWTAEHSVALRRGQPDVVYLAGC